jgi:hypothetical protein
MIDRKLIPVNDEYAIAIVTERMSDGKWAVVASIKHDSPTGEQTIDLPVRDEHYADQQAAEEAGLGQAREWLAQNVANAA